MGGSIFTRDHVRQASAIPNLQGVLMDALLFIEHPDLVASAATPCA
jgi:hypothetical protein